MDIILPDGKKMEDTCLEIEISDLDNSIEIQTENEELSIEKKQERFTVIILHGQLTHATDIESIYDFLTPLLEKAKEDKL